MSNGRPQILKARRYVSPLFAVIVVLITYLQFPGWIPFLIATVVGGFVAWFVLPRLLDSAVDKQLKASIEGAAAEAKLGAAALRQIVWSDEYAFVMVGVENGIVVPLQDDTDNAKRSFLRALEAHIR